MSMRLFANYLSQYFEERQTPVVEQKQEKKVEKFIPQFLHSEEIFADILPSVNSNEFYSVSLIGTQGHGKTFAAAELSTHAAKEGFLTVYGKAEDILLDLQTWIDNVKMKIIEHGNPQLCICLDDMSYSSGTISSKKAAAWKHFIGDIRHKFEDVLGEGTKPKMFMIYISHRYHSVPPILRNSGTWIFASMQNEDRSDAQHLIPKNVDQQQRLDDIYQFLGKVTVLGPKFKIITLGDEDSNIQFRWGNKEDPGNGRLMMIYHSGEMKIYNPRKIENMVDLDKCRIIYTLPTEEEVKLKKQRLFEDKAREITAVINTKTAKDPERTLECKLCGCVMKTRRKEGEVIQCSRCRKVVQSLDTQILRKNNSAVPKENQIQLLTNDRKVIIPSKEEIY